MAPFRADGKERLGFLITDLEVNDESKDPFKVMRYPLEDGKKHQQLLTQREAWFTKFLQFETPKAKEWTRLEFSAFYSTQNELLNEHDPGNTIAKLQQEKYNEDLVNAAAIDTRKFFAQAQKGLIRTTPMKTYPKFSYYSGMNLDLYREGEFPKPLSIWALNAPKLVNIITQLNLPGVDSLDDIQQEMQNEKNFVFVAADYGQTVQKLNVAESVTNNDFLHRQMSSFPGYKKPVTSRQPRPLRRRGTQSTDEDSEITSTASENVLSTDGETYIGSEYNQPRLSLDPAHALPPPQVASSPSVTLQSQRNTRLDFGRAISRRSKESVTTFEPDSTAPEKVEPLPLTTARPRRAFRGRFFPNMGMFTPMLIGTEVFPITPKQEKAEFEIATGAPINHFDGDIVEDYIDDIKVHWRQILESMDPICQNDSRFLCRYNNPKFIDQWKVKFPFAKHRILEYGANNTKGSALSTVTATHDAPIVYDSIQPAPKLYYLSGVSSTHGGVKTDHVVKVNTAELENRMARTSLFNIWDKVDRPEAITDFELRYTKYQNKVNYFLEQGTHWTQPADFDKKVDQLRQLDTVNQFRSWLFESKPTLKELNMIHNSWLTFGHSARKITRTKAVQIGHWITIVFNYSNFKELRPLVSQNTIDCI